LIVGAGDDAAVIAAPDRRVVAATDLLIEGRHFRREWSGGYDIGAKAAARNLIDVAAMGARPTALLIGMAVPGDLPASWALDLVKGLVAECQAAGAVVAGGDTSGSETIMLGVTALGELGGAEPVTRGGARPGDLVALAGAVGSAAAGLALLAAGASDRGSASGSASGSGSGSDRGAAAPAGDHPGLAELIAAHRRPRPPYQAGPQAAAAGATAMIDISDGLIADLGHVARASGVRIQLATGPLTAGPAVHATALAAAADTVGASWLDWVLTGGDDHALAATFPAGTPLPPPWTVIGEVVPGSGVTVDGVPWSGAGGWQHFSVSS
jgi:thiamine-monophosphate kinase